MSALRCRPIGLCIAVLVMLLLFILLGFWQLDRAAEKVLILEQEADRKDQVISSLSLNLKDYSPLRYSKARIEGVYDHVKQFLLDNQVKNHQAGYNVFTPVKIDAGRAVLIDRGWVPQGQTRQLLPDVSLRKQSLGQLLQIEGVVYVPFGKGFRLGELDENNIIWPRVIQYLDFKAMSERLGYDLLPVVLRLSPQAAQGYLRQWKTVNFGPERHYGYAFQWFSLALAMVVIFAILVLKRVSDD